MTTATTPADLAAQVRALTDTGRARELREGAALTLMDAAKACGGVHPSNVSRWERGLIPRGRNLRAYARFLNRLAEREAVAS
jgi:transcriptional regulator with XRE-family HTH domain